MIARVDARPLPADRAPLAALRAGRRADSSAANLCPPIAGTASPKRKQGLGWLDAIAATDTAFSGRFRRSARKAYEIIVSPSPRGSRHLARLLSADVFDGFAAEISGGRRVGRASSPLSSRSTPVSTMRARCRSRTGHRAFNQQADHRAAQPPGEVIEGNPVRRRRSRFVDFRAQPCARDPNWKACRTETVH